MSQRSQVSAPLSLGLPGIRGVRLAPPVAAFVYLLRCADGTLYCGWSTDPERRLRQHQAGTASRYTRTRRPVELVYTREFATRSEAMREEVRIKRLPPGDKRRLRLDAAEHRPSARSRRGRASRSRRRPGSTASPESSGARSPTSRSRSARRPHGGRRTGSPALRALVDLLPAAEEAQPELSREPRGT